MFFKTFYNHCLLKGLITAATISNVAYGQDTPLPSSEEDNVDVIVVTGSNIRSRSKDFKTPSPVQTMGKTEIENTGALQVQDIFKGLTVNSGSQTANRQTAMQGLSQFSLRGLGIGSTLTLINGRRGGLAPVTDSSGQLFTDINQYPTNMIGRIEISLEIQKTKPL